MAGNYTAAVLKETVGGPDEQHNDNFLLSQTQHILSDDSGKLYATMMLNRNIRIINLSDNKSVEDTEDTMDIDMPAGMCFHGDDKMLVCDLNGDKVVICNREDGKYLETVDVSVSKPNTITKDPEGNIYVGEVGDDGDRLRCFDSSWKLKYAIKSVNDKDLTGVNNLCFDAANSRILISDSDANAVHAFSSADGAHVFSLTEDNAYLMSPQGIAVDHYGNILVCDMANNCVRVFDSEGKFLSKFGSDADLFSYPMDIVVNSKNKRALVVDGSIFAGWSRVQIFEY